MNSNSFVFGNDCNTLFEYLQSLYFLTINLRKLSLTIASMWLSWAKAEFKPKAAGFNHARKWNTKIDKATTMFKKRIYLSAYNDGPVRLLAKLTFRQKNNVICSTRS